MSKVSTVDITCPNCGKEASFEMWNSVETEDKKAPEGEKNN